MVSLNTSEPLIRSSLLDRLYDERPASSYERISLNQYDEKAYRRSVLRDLDELFNTRSVLTVARYRSERLTVRDFGIPDLLHLSPGSADDRLTLTQVVSTALKFFETRLHDVLVEVQAESIQAHCVSVLISGWLEHPDAALYFSFVATEERMRSGWVIHERT